MKNTLVGTSPAKSMAKTKKYQDKKDARPQKSKPAVVEEEEDTINENPYLPIPIEGEVNQPRSLHFLKR